MRSMVRIGSDRSISQSVSQSITRKWSYLVWTLRSTFGKFETSRSVFGQGPFMSLYVRLSLLWVVGAAYLVCRT